MSLVRGPGTGSSLSMGKTSANVDVFVTGDVTCHAALSRPQRAAPFLVDVYTCLFPVLLLHNTMFIINWFWDVLAQLGERRPDVLVALAGLDDAVELEGELGEGLPDPVVQVPGDAVALLLGAHRA